MNYPKNMFHQRTDCGFQCANSQSESKKKLFFFLKSMLSAFTQNGVNQPWYRHEVRKVLCSNVWFDEITKPNKITIFKCGVPTSGEDKEEFRSCFCLTWSLSSWKQIQIQHTIIQYMYYSMIHQIMTEKSLKHKL